MKTRMAAAFAGAVVMVTAGVPALAADPEGGTVSTAPASASSPPSPPMQRERSEDPADDEAGEPGDEKAGRAGRDKADRGHRHGPPSWAHGRHSKGGTGPRGSAWKRLSPEQRAGTMARLTRSHTTGMKKWATCVAAGQNDCVKPLPPGLAKTR